MDRVEIKDQRKISVDSIVEKIDYVKLGETGDVLIGKVTDLLITPDHIIVGDTRQAKAVFIFDRAGNSQAVISRLGRGPQEYMDLSTIFLTPDQQTIGIVDNSMKKLLYFDLQGNFIKKQDLPFSCNGIEFLDDKKMMLVSDGWADKSPVLESYPNKNDLLFFTDTTLQIQSSAIVNPFDVNKFHFAPVYKKRFDDRIYVGKAFGDTIYQIFILFKWPVAFIITYFIIKCIYTLAPDKNIKSRYMTRGAVFTALGWILVTAIYSYYVSHFANYDIFYGSLSNLIIMMIWIYILAYILVIGIAINVETYERVVKISNHKTELDEHSN